MKNLLFVVVITCIVISCDEPKAKIYACQEYSLSCELQKDHLMVLPIVFNSATFDACGYKMADAMKKNQWYLISTKAPALVPVRNYICLSRDANGCNEFTETPTPEQLLKDLQKDDKNIRIDTTDLSFLVPGLTKVAMVVSGPNEVIYSSLASPVLARPKK